MMVKVAIDTNLLACAEGAGDERRRARAVEILDALPEGAVVVPVQVLGELYRVLVSMLRRQPAATGSHAGERDAKELQPHLRDLIAPASVRARKRRRT